MSWLPKQTVLVPVDLSKASLDAIDVARELISEPGKLHIVHVTQPLHVAEPGMLWGTITDTTRVETAGKELRDQVAARGLGGVRVHDKLGIPAREIAELAKEVHADLIVMPSHGRSGLQRFFLGSVTEKVLRMAECPVLVLRSGESNE